MLGNIISAGANFIGGLIGQNAQAEQQEQNRALQREFAQSGIQWKVADARAAGIHPMYALGAPTMSPAVSVQGSPMASAVSAMGQDIGRGINATRSVEDRNSAFNDTVQAMQVTRMGLENDLLASQIARIRDNPNPPMPTGSSRGPKGGTDPTNITEENEFKERARLAFGGKVWPTDPGTSSAEQWEDRYGDEGMGSLMGFAVFYKDMITQYGPPKDWPPQIWRAVNEAAAASKRGEGFPGGVQKMFNRAADAGVRNVWRSSIPGRVYDYFRR